MGYIDILIGDGDWSRVVRLASLICLVRSHFVVHIPMCYGLTRSQYPAIIWIYNILFHPLAKFPGPLLWRASRLPYMRAVWGGHFPHEIQKLHAQYGDVVRTAPNELSFADATAWDDIYSNRDGANPSAFRKSELWHGNPEGGPTSVFTTTDLKEHARIRRFLDPAFSERLFYSTSPSFKNTWVFA